VKEEESINEFKIEIDTYDDLSSDKSNKINKIHVMNAHMSTIS
jgi:hypothetical protein